MLTLAILKLLWRVILIVMGTFLFIFAVSWQYNYDHYAWLVDCGPRGELHRQAAVDILFNGEEFSYADSDVDFRNRRSRVIAWTLDGNEDADTTPREHFDFYEWAPSGDDEFKQEQAGPVTQTAFTTHAINNSFPSAPNVIHVCHPVTIDMDSGDSNHAFVYEFPRKEARIHMAYETAAEMTSALRSTLAHLKAGQQVIPGKTVYGPLDRDDAHPMYNSYCNIDGADPASYTPAQIAAYRAMTHHIHLYHAPVVRYRYFGKRRGADFSNNSANGISHDPEEFPYPSEQIIDISGACLVVPATKGDPVCLPEPYYDPDLRFFVTTTWHDLYDTVPVISPVQEAVERETISIASLAFWETAARENGVTDMQAVDAMHDYAVKNLVYEMTDETPKESRAMVIQFMETYAGYVPDGNDWGHAWDRLQKQKACQAKEDPNMVTPDDDPCLYQQ